MFSAALQCVIEVTYILHTLNILLSAFISADFSLKMFHDDIQCVFHSKIINGLAFSLIVLEIFFLHTKTFKSPKFSEHKKCKFSIEISILF